MLFGFPLVLEQFMVNKFLVFMYVRFAITMSNNDIIINLIFYALIVTLT